MMLNSCWAAQLVRCGLWHLVWRLSIHKAFWSAYVCTLFKEDGDPVSVNVDGDIMGDSIIQSSSAFGQHRRFGVWPLFSVDATAK